MITLRLLGGASLETSAGPVTGRAAQRQRLALLANLAIAHPRLLSRDRLIADLWPESDTERGRHLLRDSLYVLRSGLGEDVVLNVGDDVRLNPERISCDVWLFEVALAEGRLEVAADSYGGPFLDGFHINAAPEFERWVDVHRRRLADSHASVLELLAVQARDRDDARGAVTWWHRLAEQDGLNSRIAVELMRALDAAGDRAGALRYADVHSALLRDELSAEPDPEVLALAEQLRRRPAGARPATAAIAQVPPAASGSTAPAIPVSVSAAAPPASSMAESAPISAPEIAPLEPPAEAMRSPRRRTRRALIPLLLGLAILAGGSLVRGGSLELSSQRVAVDIFVNQTGDATLDPLGGMASDWIAQGLSQSGMAEVVPAAMVARWVEADPASADQRGRALARETGAGIVITGAFYRSGDTLHFQAQIIDGARGRMLKAIGPVAGSVTAPVDGIEQLRQRVLAGVLAVRDLRLALSPGAFGPPPPYPAYREYLEGLQRTWDRDWTKARKHFRRAAELDSTWVIPLLGMAVVSVNVHRYAEADSLARIVDGARDALAPFDQASLDLVFAWVRGDRIGAYEAAGRAARLVPGSVQEIQFGIEALKLNRPHEAVRILSRLDPDRGAVRHSSEYWDFLARAYHLTGQYRRELDAARKGRLAHPDNSYPVLAELRALVALGRIKEVERRASELRAGPSRRGMGTAWVLMFTAAELRAHGHGESASRVSAQSLESWRQVPDADRNDFFSLNYAISLYFAGELNEARRYFAELAERQPDTEEPRSGLGVIAAVRGDRAEAERMERWLADRQSPYLVGNRMLYRAFIAVQLGERERAVELLRAAFARGREYDIYMHSDPDLTPLRGYPPFDQLMRPKD